MSKLFNVKFKIGKRSFSSKIYATDFDSILSFCSKHLVAKVTSIEEVVYEAPDSTIYPEDNVGNYKGTFNFLVGNKDVNKINKFIFQTVKLTSSVQEVFEDMKNLLYLDKTTRIKSFISGNISSK